MGECDICVSLEELLLYSALYFASQEMQFMFFVA